VIDPAKRDQMRRFIYGLQDAHRTEFFNPNGVEAVVVDEQGRQLHWVDIASTKEIMQYYQRVAINNQNAIHIGQAYRGEGAYANGAVIFFEIEHRNGKTVLGKPLVAPDGSNIF